MEFQSFIDKIEPMSCIISVEKFSDGSYGNIRLVTGNRKYIESIENADTISSSQMLKNTFIPNSPYEDYIPKDLNFEDACYRSAILKKPYHTYIHPDRYSFWIDMYMMPLASDEENIGYCLYTQEFTEDENSGRMSNVSASISSTVLQTCLKLKGSKDFQRAIEETLADIREICSADKCSILLTDYKERKCTILCQVTAPGVQLAPFNTSVQQQGFEDFFDIVDTWQDTIAGSTCLIVKNEKDMEILKERNPAWQRSLVGAGINSLVLFPLVYGEDILGYIWALNFDTKNAMMIKETLELTTRLVASEIANYQILNQLKRLGTMDVLTGVMNRNAMNNRIDFLTQDNNGLDRFGVVIADLNGLKQTNDNEGHIAGDKLLKAAAALLSDVFHDAEIYRAGGDEFLIIAPDVPEEELEERVKRLRTCSETPEKISFALGLYYDNNGGDISTAMRIADQRMYQDKKNYYKRFPERSRRR